jgi:hypothetical protein
VSRLPGVGLDARLAAATLDMAQFAARPLMISVCLAVLVAAFMRPEGCPVEWNRWRSETTFLEQDDGTQDRDGWRPANDGWRIDVSDPGGRIMAAMHAAPAQAWRVGREVHTTTGICHLSSSIDSFRNVIKRARS